MTLRATVSQSHKIVDWSQRKPRYLIRFHTISSRCHLFRWHFHKCPKIEVWLTLPLPREANRGWGPEKDDAYFHFVLVKLTRYHDYTLCSYGPSTKSRKSRKKTICELWDAVLHTLQLFQMCDFPKSMDHCGLWPTLAAPPPQQQRQQQVTVM